MLFKAESYAIQPISSISASAAIDFPSIVDALGARGVRRATKVLAGVGVWVWYSVLGDSIRLFAPTPRFRSPFTIEIQRRHRLCFAMLTSTGSAEDVLVGSSMDERVVIASQLSKTTPSGT